MSSKNRATNGWHAQFENFVNYFALIACFISYEKWMQIEKYPSRAYLP